jgi:hypothetical protein
MATSTTPTMTQLKDAYAMIIEAEKKLVTDLETLVNDFYGDLELLEAGFPVDASAAQARQLLSRVKNAMVNIKSYDLPNVKAQYGIDVVPAGTAGPAV